MGEVGALEAVRYMSIAVEALHVFWTVDGELKVIGVGVGGVGAALAVVVLGRASTEWSAGEAEEVLQVEALLADRAGSCRVEHKAVVGGDGLGLPQDKSDQHCEHCN